MFNAKLALSAITALAFVACAHNPTSENDNSGKEREPAQEDQAAGIKYREMKVDDGHVSVINVIGKNVESPVVSADGRKMLVISDLGKAPVDMVIKDLTKPDDTGTKISKGTFDLFIKGSFLESSNDIVACELDYQVGALLKTVSNYVKSKDWDPIGYHSVISFYTNGKKRGQFDAATFGLPKKTFLEHPRVSPNQKWLTFYVQPGTEVPTTSTQGIYVYNFATKKTFYLGNHADKHPTWDSSGERIFFHEQGAMGKTEIARVGYYKLQFDGDTVSVKDRIFFADPNHTLGDMFIYQKHPAYHKGLNLVFFHISEGEDCGTDGPKCHKALGAISLDHPEHKPVAIKMTYNGQKVSHTEHVDLSEQEDSPLYFVGRVNGEDKDKLLSLDYATLQQVRQQLNQP